MRSARTIAAAYLAIGFAIVTAIAVLVEPGMGFHQFTDFFDPAKLVPGLVSVAWLVDDVLYLGFAVALVYLAGVNDDWYLRVAGITAAASFFLIGCMGRVFALLPHMVADSNQLDAAALGALTVRFAALKVTVFALGVFAWRTSVADPATGPATALGRTLGLLTLAGGIVFILAFIPMPVLITIWAAWLTVRYARAARVGAPVPS
jgi:hypothetical protein